MGDLTTTVKQIIKTLLTLVLLPFVLVTNYIWKLRNPEKYQQIVDSLKRNTEIAVHKVGGKSTFIRLSEVSLHAVTAGPENGELVVLVHGFPDNWFTWEHQIPFLTKQGYFVVAIDMRGYNLSEKKPNVSDYDVKKLSRDIAEVISHYKREKAILIAHDWGAIVSWVTAMTYPNLLSKLIILNVPHPTTFFKNFTLEQACKSWYMYFFQLPYLPEILLSYRPELVNKIYPSAAKYKSSFSDLFQQLVAGAIAQPGAATAMINYYRSLIRSRIFGPKPSQPTSTTVVVPTKVIWGENDIALGKYLNNGIEKYVPNVQVKYIPDVGHFVQHEAHEQVNAEILKFLQ